MSAPTQLTPSELFAKLDSEALNGPWTLDTARSSVTIATKSMWGLAKIKGEFTRISGQATVAGDAVAATISIAADSIDTKNAKRDKHLKSEDFLASESYPELVFTLNSIKPAADTVTVEGTLTVRDTVRPVSFDGVVSLAGDEVTLASALPVDRSDYGINWNQLGMASMANMVTLKAVFARG